MTSLTTLVFALLLAEAQPVVVVNPTDYEPCALNCLYTINAIRKLGHEYEIVRSALGPSDRETNHTVLQVLNAAGQLGLNGIGVSVTWNDLRYLPQPIIAMIRRPDTEANHFVVICDVNSEKVVILNPPEAPRIWRRRGFEKLWDGTAIVFPKDEAEAKAIIVALEKQRAKKVTLITITVAAPILVALWVSFCGMPLIVRNQLRRAGALFTTIGLKYVVAIVTISAVAIGWPQFIRARCEVAKRIDLGELDAGQHTATLVVRNRGWLPLTVHDIKSTCTCAVSEIPATIQARGEVPVSVTVSAKPGSHSAKLIVESDDPDGESSIELSWFTRFPLQVRPALIYARAQPSSRRFHAPVALSYQRASTESNYTEPELVRAQCMSNSITVIPEAVQPKESRGIGKFSGPASQQYLMQITIDPPIGSTNVKDVIELEIRLDGRINELKIPVDVGFSGGSFSPKSESVVFSASNQADLLDQERVIELLGGEAAPAITKAPEWISWRSAPLGNGLHGLFFRIKSIPPGPIPRSEILHIAPVTDTDKPIPIYLYFYVPSQGT